MRWWAGAALVAILAAGTVRAEDRDPNAATRLLPATANGSLVYRVYVYLENPGDDEVRNVRFGAPRAGRPVPAGSWATIRGA